MANTHKVAIASKDGISINLHFGHADTFWVYSILQQGYVFEGKRDVEKYCHGHLGSKTAMQNILETIKDCDAVFSAKIGDGPVEKLRKIGVQSVDGYAYESVEESLLDYAAKVNTICEQE